MKWYILSQNLLQALISVFEYLWSKAVTYLLRAKSENILQPEMPQAREGSGVPAELRHRAARAEKQWRAWVCQATRAQAVLRGGGHWGSKFLHWDIWKPCVHISAFVALPWGTAWLWPSVPDSLIPTLANRLHYPEPWECRVIHPPPGPFAAVCGLFSPWSLPAFEPQTIHKPEGLVPAQWGFGKGLTSTLGSHTPLFPAFPRKRVTQKRADLLLGLAFIHVPADQAEEMSLDAWEEKLFQDERGLLSVLLHFPRAECVVSFRVWKSATTLKKTILYLSAFVRKPLQGKDEIVKNN